MRDISCSAAITNQNIQNPVIPPALWKIWQLVFQGVLQKLKHDWYDCGEPPVTEDEGLAPVAERVCKNEDIKLLQNVVKRIIRFLPVVNPTISAIIFFRDRITELFVQVLE